MLGRAGQEKEWGMTKRNLALIAVLMLSLLVAGNAFAGSNTDRATGGGQILVGDNAGSTIAFTAHGTSTDADGQAQIVDRSGGKGPNQAKFHGVVDCLRVETDFAEIGGLKRGGGRFTIFVEDTDQGGPQNGTEMIAFVSAGSPTCNSGDRDDANMELARGNAQVYDAGA